MKKILSVLLAGAMVMGMSVSAFAATFGGGADAADHNYDVETLVFDKVFHDGVEYTSADDIKILEAGDMLYFRVDEILNAKVFGQEADKDWRIKINNADYVKGATFVFDDEDKIYWEDALYVAVELSDEFDHFDEDEVKFYFYIYDMASKKSSERVYVEYDFLNYGVVELDEADVADVIPVTGNNYYTLDKDVFTKSQTVVFEFAEGVFVTAKMWPGEKYLVKGVDAFVPNKALSKEYDADIEILTLDTELDIREVLFESAKDNKQVVSLVDGALVAVESEFVTKHEVIEDVVLAKGYIADAEDNGAYALIDADIELIEVEEEAKEEDTTKENPSTGANDFVGAAVALAVVSVAAAGALALKK